MRDKWDYEVDQYGANFIFLCVFEIFVLRNFDFLAATNISAKLLE